MDEFKVVGDEKDAIEEKLEKNLKKLHESQRISQQSDGVGLCLLDAAQRVHAGLMGSFFTFNKLPLGSYLVRCGPAGQSAERIAALKRTECEGGEQNRGYEPSFYHSLQI